MITKYQANLENNHIRGITNYTPPTYTYIGLSTVAIDDSGTLPENAEPDASTGYARIRVRNNSETWNDSANGVISNKIRLEFPNEFTANAGIAIYIFELDEAGKVMYYSELTQEITLYQGMNVFFAEGDITFERTNQATVSS